MIDYSMVMKIFQRVLYWWGEKKLDYDVDGQGFDYLMCNWYFYQEL